MTFRTILRDATRAEHDRLDQMFAALDLTQVDGMAQFVSVHSVCFRLMSEQAEHGGTSYGMLREMVRCLDDDAGVLNVGPVQTSATVSKRPDPLAIDYIVAGSRLGTKVLSKQWSTATDPIVRRANAYFGLGSDPAFWRATCTRLEGIAPRSARAAEITQDTKMQFDLFSTVFQSADVR